MENQSTEKKPNKAGDALKKALPHVKAAGQKAEQALTAGSDKMVEIGGKIGAAMPEFAPGLAQVCVIQALYSLAVAVLSIATGSSGVLSLLVANLPLAVYASASVIKKLKK